MKIRMNPIMKKDFKVTARSMKMAWGLMAYEAILAFMFIIAITLLSLSSEYSYQNIYSELNFLFPWIGIAQICITALTIPIMTASSISGEKERQTFDIMLTTCLSPRAIVAGKVFSSVMEVMLYVVASIPIMSLTFILGGLSWGTLFLFLVVIFVFAIFAGSIGVFCSSISRKSIVSIILSFVGYFLVCFLTVLPMLIVLFATRGDEVYDSTIFLLLNPIVFLEEFFMLAMTGESLFSGELLGDFGFFTDLLAHGPLWCIISGVCMLGLAMLFMLLAAKKIDPLTGKVKKIARKQPIVQSAFVDQTRKMMETFAGNASDVIEQAEHFEAGEAVDNSDVREEADNSDIGEETDYIDAGEEVDLSDVGEETDHSDAGKEMQ